MPYRVAISGSYGQLNLGDEAILDGMLSELKSLDLDIVVFSYNPEDTEKRHGVKAFPIREMHKDEILKVLEKLDLYIIGGGGILFDGFAEHFMRTVLWAQELKVPVVVYAVSAGPLNNPDSKKLVADGLNQAALIIVRDEESKRILNDIGVTQEIHVTADPAFLIKAQNFSKEAQKSEGIQPENVLVGFSVREPGPAAPDLNIEQYHSILANAADFMIERYDAKILFIPMELGPNKDLQHSHAVISKMFNAQKANVLQGDYTHNQILGLLENMSFTVGMRLHFLIFSASKHIPFIPLPYASKVKGLMDDLDLPITPIEHWNAGKLCAVIDRAWDTRKKMVGNLEKNLPNVLEKAKRSKQLLAEFLKTLTPKKS